MNKTSLLISTLLLTACGNTEKPLTTPEKTEILEKLFTEHYKGNVYQVGAAMDYVIAAQDINPSLPLKDQIRAKYAIQTYGCLKRSVHNPDWVVTQVANQFPTANNYSTYLIEGLKDFRLPMDQEMCKRIPDAELMGNAGYAALWGLDDNKNGVRDDVEDTIVSDFKDFSTQLAVMRYAQKFQAKAYSDYRRPSRIEFRNTELDGAISCFSKKNYDRMAEVVNAKKIPVKADQEPHLAYLDYINNMTIDTPERKAYFDLVHSSLVSDVPRVQPQNYICE